MMPRTREGPQVLALRSAPIILFAVLFLLFGLLQPKFISSATLTNIVTQASYIGIMAVGMTFVLLVAGIDLSVGSVMYLSATVGGGWLLAAGLPIPIAVAGALLVGLVVGTLNAFLITKVGVIAFLATLATLVVVRGLALTITQSESITFPDRSARLGSTRLLGLVPVPSSSSPASSSWATWCSRGPPLVGRSMPWGTTRRRPRRPASTLDWSWPSSTSCVACLRHWAASSMWCSLDRCTPPLARGSSSR